MSEELFPPSEVAAESPKLKWMRKHGVQTFHRSLAFQKEPDQRAYGAFAGDFQTAIDCTPWAICYGPTEDDAIAAWARKNSVKLWNEE